MELISHIQELQEKVSNLYDKHIENLNSLKEKLESLIQESSKFDDKWAGSWASSDYNSYYQSNDFSTRVYTKNQIVNKIETSVGNSIERLQEDISEIAEECRKLQNTLVTELSFIKSETQFVSESELLDKIENYSWGFTPWEYVKLKQPNHIMTHNPRAILNKGLDIPPHIEIGGQLMSIFSTYSAIIDFFQLSNRILRQVELKSKMDESTDNKAETRSTLYNLINTFHIVTKQLQNRHDKRSTIEIKDEYDVQDLLHALLKIKYQDVRPEEYTPSYAGGSTRVDFLLKREQIVIEVKKTRLNLKDKEVGNQLILDVQHYKAHPDCKRLICFVYDPENFIENPRGLEDDLNLMSSDDMIVEVFIKP